MFKDLLLFIIIIDSNFLASSISVGPGATAISKLKCFNLIIFIKYGENSKKFSEKFHWNKVVKNYLKLIN